VDSNPVAGGEKEGLNGEKFNWAENLGLSGGDGKEVNPKSDCHREKILPSALSEALRGS